MPHEDIFWDVSSKDSPDLVLKDHINWIFQFFYYIETAQIKYMCLQLYC